MNYFRNIEDAYLELLNTLVYKATTNELGTREVFGWTFMVENISEAHPLTNFRNVNNRNINIPFQSAYAKWFLSGSNDTTELTTLNKNVALYNGGVLYPQRIESQLQNVVDELKSNPYSRRATIMILESSDSDIMVEKRTNPSLNKEYPCTIAISLFIRDGELHSDVMMRSNNTVSTICYDMTNFTYLQNHISEKLDIKSGNMIYHIVNAHIEPKDYELAKQIVDSNYV